MAKRIDIINTILEACKAVVPEASWGFRITGAKKSNLIEGTVTCDEATFEWIAKGKQHATSKFNIVLIELDGTHDIDSIADRLFDVFNGSNMGGMCYNVNITRAVYGAIPAVLNSKAVKLELDVEYPVN